MTRLLALDTSTWWAGIALVEGDTGRRRVLAELGLTIDGSHAGALLERVEALLSIAGVGREALDGWVAVRGPGSFTGLRIGLGTLRGLGVATGRPAFGVNGLAAIAAAAGPSPVDRLVVLEAGRGELYAARFDGDGDPPRMLEETRLLSRESLAEGADETPVLVVPGPGTTVDAGGLPPGRRLAEAPRSIAAAAGLLALAAVDGTIDDPRLVQRDEAIAPLYVRVPDAVLNRRAPGD